MKKTVFEIFRECFPQFPMPMEKLMICMDYEACSILTIEEEGETVGFSAVRDNSIRLLCVRPSYRHKGYGSRLLSMSEEKIAAEGYQVAVLGGESSKLFIGAVTSKEDYLKKSNPYFEKRGYKADEGCVEMKLALQDFKLEEVKIKIPEDIIFRYYDLEDRQPLYDAVADVQDDWVQYFLDSEHVFCAYNEGKIMSLAILDYEDDNILCKEGAKIGSIGCVGTVPAERKKGSGLALVALATEELKKQGCDEVFIHFTTLDKWYGKLGYEIFMYYWFGKKEL